MSADLKIAFDEFQRAAAIVSERSSRTFPQFINGQAFAAANRALRATEKADAGKIAVQLGQVATAIRMSKKTGKFRATRVYSPDENTLAARIINARRRASGEKMLFGRELVAAVRKMVGARLRAVAFIRSGWLEAIRTLAGMVGYEPGATRVARGDSARRVGQPKGYVRPARFTLSGIVSCEIGNTALIADGSNPMPVAQRGLTLGLQETARDMMQHLQRKLQPICNEVSAKRS